MLAVWCLWVGCWIGGCVVCDCGGLVDCCLLLVVCCWMFGCLYYWLVWLFAIGYVVGLCCFCCGGFGLFVGCVVWVRLVVCLLCLLLCCFLVIFFVVFVLLGCWVWWWLICFGFGLCLGVWLVCALVIISCLFAYVLLLGCLVYLGDVCCLDFSVGGFVMFSFGACVWVCVLIGLLVVV